ncbi:MAG: 5-methyltetrahydropteroyltriglutamate--homocysteine S-methyltransferase, partial [Acidimicrobiales bacterium]
MRTAVHGMARIGERRALKWALESYWAGRASADELDAVAAAVRRDNWNRLARAGVSFVPSNDFSLYDHVVDTALSVSAIPERFDTKALSLEPFNLDSGRSAKGNRFDLTRYFAMARGATEGGRAIAPLQMTKWFDTNYHHLVPEIGPATRFAPEPAKARGELTEAAELGISTTPVLVGPLTFLLRSAATEPGFQPLDLLDALVETYVELLAALARHGAAWVRLDEPALVEDRSTSELIALHRAYRRLGEAGTHPKIAVATYFGHVGAAMATLRDLPVDGIGLDLCAGPENAELLADVGGFGDKTLFAGVVDGRNVWANDLDNSLDVLDQLGGLCGELVVSTSCSLIHVPQSLAAESRIDPEISGWLAFGDEKLTELAVLARGAGESRAAVADALEKNREVLAARRHSPLVNDQAVQRASRAAPLDPRRPTQAPERAALQRTALGLPLLPVTTIGSFPQTPELRGVRASWRAGRTTDEDYEAALRREVDRVVELQEALGLDVVVHGEPERDDMVRYFATHLSGFALPEEGWVQSYGSRCVRPPILFGDVRRPAPITLGWARYAQARTQKPVKGMLTGPVTMLRWSFVRDDQPHA